MELKTRVLFDVNDEPLKEHGYYNKYVRLFFNPETGLEFLGYLIISKVKKEITSPYEEEYYFSLDFVLQNNSKVKARYKLIDKHLEELRQEDTDEKSVIIRAIRHALHRQKPIVFDHFPLEFPKNPGKRFYSNKEFIAIPIKTRVKEKTLDEFIK